MAAKHRVFLTGNDRNEAEHVLGFKLPVDDSDPRFVLLTDEQEEAIRKFPPGAPANRGDNWQVAKVVLEAQRGEGPLHEAFGNQGGDPKVAESATPVPKVGEKSKSDVKADEVEKLDAARGVLPPPHPQGWRNVPIVAPAEDKAQADENPTARKASGKAKS